MGKPKTPKEDPADRAARLRERRITELERGETAQETAAGLTSDIRAIYGSQPGTAAGQPMRPLRPASGKPVMDINTWMRQMVGLK